MPPCSAAATSAAGVSVSPAAGRRSAGHGLVVAAGGREKKRAVVCRLVVGGCVGSRIKQDGYREGVVMADIYGRFGVTEQQREPTSGFGKMNGGWRVGERKL